MTCWANNGGLRPGEGEIKVKVGDKVADFEAVDQHGQTVALSDLLETGPVVMYFYPKAMTPG